jgi:hypothetical protein
MMRTGSFRSIVGSLIVFHPGSPFVTIEGYEGEPVLVIKCRDPCIVAEPDDAWISFLHKGEIWHRRVSRFDFVRVELEAD